VAVSSARNERNGGLVVGQAAARPLGWMVFRGRTRITLSVWNIAGPVWASAGAGFHSKKLAAAVSLNVE
jgi:hypothetical protein